MAVQILRAKRRSFPAATPPVPHIDEVPNATPVEFVKTKSSVCNPVMTEDVKKDRQEVQLVVKKALETGFVHQRHAWNKTDTTDPALREEFGKLLYMGAPRTTICEILKISIDTYHRMKKQHLMGVVEALAETGVMGMVAQSFDKLEMISGRTLQLIASLGDKVEDRQDLLRALGTLKDIESEKISLLVKTGAIRVKKKTEISAHMEQLTGGSTTLLTGEKGQEKMVRLLSALVEETSGIDGEEISFDNPQ